MTITESVMVQKILDQEIARLIEASPTIAQLPPDEKRNIWLSMWRAVNRCQQEDNGDASTPFTRHSTLGCTAGLD